MQIPSAWHKVDWGTRDDGSMWLSIGDPGRGYHQQADWNFGEEMLILFVTALEREWADKVKA